MLLCEVKGISKHFGGLAAINGIDLSIYEGQNMSIIGPNGAGKTTFLNVISGTYGPSAGTIFFKGENITGLKAHRVCRKRIARTFQLTRVVKKLTLVENVLMGALFRSKRLNKAKEEALRWIDFVNLTEKWDRYVLSLTYAECKRLEIARALATNPQMLLLDEPLGGLNPKEVGDACDLIRKINELGITVVMVEHVMKGVMALSQRIAVFNFGEKIAEGEPSEIMRDENVIKAYLGKVYAESKRG